MMRSCGMVWHIKRRDSAPGVAGWRWQAPKSAEMGQSQSHMRDKRCRLNRSTQHSVEVYWRGFEILRFFLDADLIAAPLRPGPLGCSPTDRVSLGSIVVIAHSCFRSSNAARGFADRRNKLAHPWPW